ncbi:sulfurtransferase [Rossellomorea aquimaris]|uniref:sulfurtransferase n=1 Tax=Rossellomorea aquimaris TaxID=189382 RepID=UPI001CD64631|nr:sulfurtransferase [Rossellomorea aquimaris]MCA1054577.1 sulfurtransferase [Rossellomorea aquimaris]
MNCVKSVEWVKNHLNDRRIRVIDCSFSLGKPSEGKTLYGVAHIPGAVYFDLEKDLSGHVKEHGGRHPLPNMKNFLRKIEQAGIDNESIIICYDQGEGAFAGRCWWLLRYLGHEEVFVLNGGFQAWKDAGYDTDSHVPDYPGKSYKPVFNEDLLVDVEEVERIAEGKSDACLIDSRSKERYAGLEEPIDRIPGHIPRAVNFPWTEGLQNGFFKDITAQKERFSGLDQNKTVVVYCGSGVTATPNIMALIEAGFKDVRLYAGSYSDWVSYGPHKVEKD